MRSGPPGTKEVLSLRQTLGRGQVAIGGFCGTLEPNQGLDPALECSAVKNVISMEEHLSKTGSRSLLVRDRRFAIRHPFAADAIFLDMETGSSAEGVTSDLSMGGCFVCTSKPLEAGSRLRLTLRRKEQLVEALAVVRIVKPRVGMGLEFLDVESRHQATLERWLEQLRRDR